MSELYGDKKYLTFPKGYERLDRYPFEKYTLFSNKNEILEYAKSNPVAYVGQIVSTTETDSKIYKIVKIGKDASTLEVSGNEDSTKIEWKILN